MEHHSDIIKLKNVQTVKHKHELAYDDDIDHKFLHTDHNKNQHDLYVMYDE